MESKLSSRPQNKNFSKNTPMFSCVDCRKEMGINMFARHTNKRCLYWQRKHGLLLPKRSGGWNKGLTKDSNPSIRKAAETYSARFKAGLHLPRKKNCDKKIQYRNDCIFRFNVYDYPDRFNLKLLERHGWYHPVNNPRGVSRDHIVSIAEGWKNNVNPRVMGHICNCKLMLHSDNKKKGTKSDLTIENLQSNIDMFIITQHDREDM